jgi:chorismate mutase
VSLPSISELADSLDDELMDLLSERLKLASMVPAPNTPEEIERQVLRMRGLAAVYRLPPDVGEKVALVLVDATRRMATEKQEGPPIALTLPY